MSPAEIRIADENHELAAAEMATTEKGDASTTAIAGSGESESPKFGVGAEKDENLEAGTAEEDESSYVTAQKRVLLSLALALAVFIIGTVRVRLLSSRSSQTR
jgi:hypothetical protein